MKYFIFFTFLFLCLIHLAENKKNHKRKTNKKFNAVNHNSLKNNKPNGNPRQTCLSTECVDTAVSYLKLLKDKIGNFEKQFSRMKVQNKTGKSKAGKKGIFGSVIRRLVRAGGGNASNLSCSGNTNSSGAEKMKNLTSSLLSCETNIKTSCDTSNLPQPNMTIVEGEKLIFAQIQFTFSQIAWQRCQRSKLEFLLAWRRLDPKLVHAGQSLPWGRICLQ